MSLPDRHYHMPVGPSIEMSSQDQLARAVEAARQATADKIQSFLQANGIRYVIALIGDSATEGPTAERNRTIIADFFDGLMAPEQYAIQTGGTQGGVPEIGTLLAKERSLPTIGVYPGAVRKYALEDSADLVIETPDILYGRTSFGSETPTFVNLLDGAVVLGGSYGTRVEVSTILRTNKSRQDALRRSPGDATLPRPIYLAPINGTGRVAEELVGMPLYEDVGDCFPTPRGHITSGLGAAAFINQKLPPVH